MFKNQARLLRRLRKQAKLTLKEVSEKLHYTPQFVSNWESGKSAPPPASHPKICRLYGIDSDILFRAHMLDYVDWLEGYYSKSHKVKIPKHINGNFP